MTAIYYPNETTTDVDCPRCGRLAGQPCRDLAIPMRDNITAHIARRVAAARARRRGPSDRDEAILARRAEGWTLARIGAEFGISTTRVSQIIERSKCDT